MKLTKQIWVCILLCFTVIIQAQEYPPVQVYALNNFGALNQTWALSQSENKTIYAANNNGLLEFNGAKWNVFPSPNKTIIRSVEVIENLIFTGSYREFGYWEKNNFDTLIYTSLSKQLNIPFLEDEEIWNIIAIDDWVLFQSLQRIYIYNKIDESYHIINSNTTIYKMFKVGVSVYFQKVNDGVYEIVNGKSKLVSAHPVIKENLLVNIFIQNNDLLFQTEDSGFYTFKNQNLSKWDIPANAQLSKLRIYSSMRLKNGTFLLGTVSEGVLLMSASGQIINKFSQNKGISNNTVLSVFEDLESNIWLGLENGINCININSPFSVYNDTEGKIGAVNVSSLYHGNLYLGTNQGLFYKKYGSKQDFTLIEGTVGAVWYLNKINNQLFCGHNSGTFIVEENKAELIVNVLGTWNITPINDSLLLQGNYSGLYIVEKNKGKWQLRNKVEGVDVSSRYVVMHAKTDVFVSHEYKGVFKLKLDENLKKVVDLEQEKSVKKGLNTGLIKFQGNILYSHRNGVFKYDDSSDKFVKDSIFSKLYNSSEYTSGKLIVDNETNKLWAVSLHGISYLSSIKLSDIPKVHKIPLPIHYRNDISGYENMSYLDNNRFLYGTSTGYITINLNSLNQKPFNVFLSSITSSKFKDKASLNSVDKAVVGQFNFEENNIQFNFNIPEYKKYLVPEYQYKLEGIYNEWSHWSEKSFELFENLPHGKYTFKLRARLGDVSSTNTETYSFAIQRPWYLSNIAIVALVLLILLFSLFMHTLYKRYYKKQREKLLLKKQRELELKESENRQQLMRYNNDNLRQDIENKNRELATSTMGLIKKNEFLSSIKTDLQNIKDTKEIKRVIKVIDKNINNADDWNLFQEAFNNVDKDFLKKIKSTHPELTSNDLRLCAYLRLNLSSKEIAPLLNISSRSVEVKRYRLRKKMNLEHETSLTDYILEI